MLLFNIFLFTFIQFSQRSRLQLAWSKVSLKRQKHLFE